ncbi:MAG: non-ribosomal peptide synthetase, partial [Bacilli bacterium]|nr:non-ribosomal peptide synthetase [Bacilli bacterium]
GYCNKPDKTNEVFTKSTDSAGMLYRSGDMGRKLSNGAIEYLGRKDFQIKIRGYRVELGEVESCLYKYPDISVAAVIAKENENKEKYLCAYFSAKKQIHSDSIRQYLKDKLPSFMIPQYIIQLDDMPYTPNGKIDRQLLKNKMVVEKEMETPQNNNENNTEGKLVDLCKKLLGVENISLESNFFDLGGHSLSAVDFVEQINKTFNVNVTLRQIYELNSIEELANLLDELMLENK